MNTNATIIEDTIEQIVNQKKIEAWDQYFHRDYVARGAPYIGIGYSAESTGEKHIINYIVPGSPAEGKLQEGDELVWAEDENQRWTSYEEIKEGILQGHRGRHYKVGVRRGEESLAFELQRGFIPGFDTFSEQAKSDMREFMTKEIPDLTARIQLIVAEGDMVVCLLEYRGTHAIYQREAVWREGWFTRLSDGKIIESWPIPDEAAYCRQLGYQIVPPSAGAHAPA